MKVHIAECVACALMTCFVCAKSYGKEATDAQASSGGVRELASPKYMDRQRSLQKLSAHYGATSTELKIALKTAATQYKDDDGCYSPLHCTILAVGSWRVFEADTLLLSIVDYELDARSLPPGISVDADFFYPAASALVRVRVDTTKVLGAMEACRNMQDLRLLTWVLLRRAGGPDEAKLILQNAVARQPTRRNLTRAIELLDRPRDLLPTRGSVDKATKSPR